LLKVIPLDLYKSIIFEKNKIMADLSQEEWASKLAQDDNSFLLDVRTEEEVEDGYIPNSKNIDIYLGQGFIDELEKLDKSKNYYVYCRSGNRSGQACAIMNSLGFENAFNLEGGFMNWEGEVQE
jgi:rhodanese-related sulfurtransferase